MLEQLRTAYSERRYDDAWALYRQLDEMGEAGPSVHLTGALTAWQKRDMFRGRAAAERALELAPTGNDLGQARFLVGLFCLHLGDVRQSIDLFRMFLSGREDYPAIMPVAEASAWYNLGLALRQAKESREAVDCYRTAVELHRAAGMRQPLRQALQNLAWTACLLGQIEMAREALDEAHGLLDSAADRWHQQVGEALLASVSRSTDDRRRAMDLCQQIVDDPGDVPPAIRAHACWVAGMVALQLGQLDAAEDLARQAIHHASLDQTESRCLRDGAELLSQVRSVRLQQTGA